ncbi:SH3 domain-containing protein [Raoultella terrigena]|uniref:SH3 domain-containing protein n=1 Tax=Raoultella terrigena TaxID=577 RepID=UPI001F16E303|nr:SH3 domain-containing protein [Raoultella terrigena]
MMKEKKTSLINNENEFDITAPSSIVEEIKCLDSLFADTATSKPFESLTQDSSVDAFFKSHNSLFASTRKQYDSLFAGAAVNSILAAQKKLQDSSAAAFLKSQDSLLASTRKQYDSLFAGAAVNSILAAQKKLQDSGAAAFLKSQDSLLASTRKQYDSLFAGAAVNSVLAAQKKLQDSSAAAFLKSQDSLLASTRKQYDSLFAGAAVNSILAAQKKLQDSGAAAFLKSQDSLLASTRKQYDSLFAGAAVNSVLAAQKKLQDSSAAAFLKSQDSLLASTRKQYDSLFAGAAVNSILAAQKKLQDSGAAAFFKKQRGILTENYFATSVAKQLEKLNAAEIQQLQEAAILFSRSPQGAAVIATNIHSVKENEPDALTKLKNHIEESPITSNFRKLPLLLQLIIIYLVTTIYSVGVDKNKEFAVYLIGQAQQYVSKAETPSPHIKKLTKQLPSEIDINTLKHIRIITGENVRLRNTPSMYGDVLVTLEKYTPVIVIDKSDRKWLYIQLSFGEQKIYGWVNRSYTKAINH